MGAVQGRFGVSMARRGHDQYLATSIVTQGPLQTLSSGELRIDEVPMTIYPLSARPRARAWVRFGPAPVFVACRIARTTRDAAGIIFTIDGTEYQCWVWGNAVRLADDAQDGIAGDSPVRLAPDTTKSAPLARPKSEERGGLLGAM